MTLYSHVGQLQTAKLLNFIPPYLFIYLIIPWLHVGYKLLDSGLFEGELALTQGSIFNLRLDLPH